MNLLVLKNDGREEGKKEGRNVGERGEGRKERNIYIVHILYMVYVLYKLLNVYLYAEVFVWCWECPVKGLECYK